MRLIRQEMYMALAAEWANHRAQARQREKLRAGNSFPALMFSFPSSKGIQSGFNVVV